MKVLIKKLKMVFYNVFKRFPNGFQIAAGKASLVKPFRDYMLRPDGNPEILSGKIRWCNTEFLFSAPLQTFWKAKYKGIENTLCRYILDSLELDGVFLDVGANYGFITLITALNLEVGSLVYSFEVQKSIFQVLQSNIEDNKLENRCICICCRVSDCDNEKENEISLDSFVEKTGLKKVSLIKIDTDGQDYRVLQGGIRIIKQFKPIVIIEMTKNQKEIVDFLRALGYVRLLDMKLNPISAGVYPVNLIACAD